MEEKELLNKFIRLKWKQLACTLYIRIFQKLGYTGDEVDLMISVEKARSQNESIVSELATLLNENEDYFNQFSGPDAVDARLAELGIRVSKEEQKAMSKEVIGREWSLDDFAERMS